MWVAVACGVAVLLGLAYLFGRAERKKSEKSVLYQGEQLVTEISELAVLAYHDHQRLCPSAVPVPKHHDPTHGTVYNAQRGDWSNDLGWSCLDFNFEATLHCQLRYTRDGDSVTVSAIYPTKTITRKGHLDRARNELVFSPIEQQARGQ